MKHTELENKYQEIREFLLTPVDGHLPTLIMAEKKFQLSHEHLCRLKSKWKKQGLM